MDRRKRNIIIMGILVLVLSSIGFTYAIWSVFFVQTDSNTIASTCFQIEFDEDETYNGITLQKAIPISEEEGLKLDPYKFTVTNKCQDYASYEVHLEIDNESTLSDYKAIRVYFDGRSFLLGSNEVVTKTLENAKTAYFFTTGYLNKGESKEYELRMWVDENADSSVAGETFLSQVTVTASYIEEDKVPPVSHLALNVCGTSIAATGSGSAREGKEISKYEYKLDDGNWEEGNTTKIYENLSNGTHKVSIKTTDNNQLVSEEYTQEVTIQNQIININGRDIPIVTCGNGLYEVDHLASETIGMDSRWQTTEYRYAGVNYTDENQLHVHNYVTFNNETWRIVGLVNVKTTDGIEQRLKITKDQPLIEKKAWDTDNKNDWTKSSLMKYLNSDYYTNTVTDDNSKNMIDENIIWNIGANSDKDYKVDLISVWYQKERGTTGSKAAPGTYEWSQSNSSETIFHSIGLLYPSDYGYATAGDSQNRNTCLKATLSKWIDLKNCYTNNWLYRNSTYWLLTPYSDFNHIFIVSSQGWVNYTDGINDNYQRDVRPALYLKQNVKIKNDDQDGSYNKPYNLEIVQE